MLNSLPQDLSHNHHHEKATVPVWIIGIYTNKIETEEGIKMEIMHLHRPECLTRHTINV